MHIILSVWLRNCAWLRMELNSGLIPRLLQLCMDSIPFLIPGLESRSAVPSPRVPNPGVSSAYTLICRLQSTAISVNQILLAARGVASNRSI